MLDVLREIAHWTLVFIFSDNNVLVFWREKNLEMALPSYKMGKLEDWFSNKWKSDFSKFCKLEAIQMNGPLESWTYLWGLICFWAFGYLYILPCFQCFQWLRSEYVGHPEVSSDRHAVRSREQGLFTQNITWRHSDCYRKLGLLSQNMGINQATHISGPTCQNSSFRFLLLLFV